MTKKIPEAEIVPVQNYPAMLDEKAATEFLQMMARNDTAQRVNYAIDVRRDEISSAVQGYVRNLAAVAAQGDIKKVFDHAHEIRGLAGTGGLAATGKIADGLCKYIDTAERLGTATEAPVIALHIDAIARACSASEEAKKHGEQVAAELGTLVERRLQAIKELKTKSSAAR